MQIVKDHKQVPGKWYLTNDISNSALQILDMALDNYELELMVQYHKYQMLYLQIIPRGQLGKFVWMGRREHDKKSGRP